MRVIAVSTHPIQYQAPWFRALTTAGVDLCVFYGVLPGPVQQGTGFGVAFEWDQPLLDGYAWERLRESPEADLHRFSGLRDRGLLRRFRRERPDAVLLTGWHSLLLVQALFAARRLRIPTLVRGDSNTLLPRAAWKRRLQALFLRRFDVFLAVGSANRRLYLRAGIGPERLFPVPHFVDNERFAASAEAARRRRGALREQWGIAPDAVCAVFAGKLIPKKRPVDLVAALAALGKAPPARHLLVVGDGELRASLSAQASEAALPVTFTGFLNQGEIASAYAAADFLALPSDAGETWGLVVNEAMACGLPALVSDRVGCAADLLSSGQTGFVHRCGDVASIAEGWRSLEADPFARRKMGEAAARRVTAEYSVERAVQGTLAALRFVAGAPRA
jgi:glycosyltransferase involved in cell wall biosynthesis